MYKFLVVAAWTLVILAASLFVILAILPFVGLNIMTNSIVMWLTDQLFALPFFQLEQVSVSTNWIESGLGGYNPFVITPAGIANMLDSLTEGALSQTTVFILAGIFGAIAIVLIAVAISELLRLKKQQKISKPYVKILLVLLPIAGLIYGQIIVIIAAAMLVMAWLLLEGVLLDPEAVSNYAEERNLITILHEEKKFEREVNKEGKLNGNVGLMKKEAKNSQAESSEKANQKFNSTLPNQNLTLPITTNSTLDSQENNTQLNRSPFFEKQNDNKKSKKYLVWKTNKSKIEKEINVKEKHFKQGLNIDKAIKKLNKNIKKLNKKAIKLNIEDKYKLELINTQNKNWTSPTDETRNLKYQNVDQNLNNFETNNFETIDNKKITTETNVSSNNVVPRLLDDKQIVEEEQKIIEPIIAFDNSNKNMAQPDSINLLTSSFEIISKPENQDNYETSVYENADDLNLQEKNSSKQISENEINTNTTSLNEEQILDKSINNDTINKTTHHNESSLLNENYGKSSNLSQEFISEKIKEIENFIEALNSKTTNLFKSEFEELNKKIEQAVTRRENKLLYDPKVILDTLTKKHNYNQK